MKKQLLTINNVTKTVKVGNRAFPFASVADWDVSTLDSVTGQRTAFIPAAAANKLNFTSANKTKDGHYEVAWEVGPASKKKLSATEAKKNLFMGKCQGTFKVPEKFLKQLTQDPFKPIKREAWNTKKSPLKKATVNKWFGREEEAKKEVLQSLGKYGFAVLRDPSIVRPSDVNKRMNSAEKTITGAFAGVLRNTHYGMMSSWSNTEDASNKTKVDGTAENEDSHLDGAYQSCHLDMHTDSTYFIEPPRVQVFGCIQRGKTTVGGETTLSDGLYISNWLKKHNKKAFDVLTKVPVEGRYFREGHYFSANRAPLQLDANGELRHFTFNNGDRAILPTPHASLTNPKDITAFYEAYEALNSAVHDEKTFIQFLLSPGDMLFFDNHRVLHGRTQFNGLRTMCGAYVGGDDVASSLRQYQLKK